MLHPGKRTKEGNPHPPSKKQLLPAAGILAVIIIFCLAASRQGAGQTAAENTLPPDEKISREKGISGKSSEGKNRPFYAGLSYKEKLSYLKKHKSKYPKRYRKMAKDYPETINFVLQYPKLHKKEYQIDLEEEASGKNVPLLIQWDKRWGYRSYGDGAIGYTGCGPTCISMVALYLTGNKKYTPLFVAKTAQKNNYYVNGEGTKWEFMSDGCKAFHIKAARIANSKKAILSSLQKHHPVICSVSAGDFTNSGHFIVLVSFKNGKFIVNDPNSRINSEKAWSYKRLRTQIRCCWAYKKDGA